MKRRACSVLGLALVAISQLVPTGAGAHHSFSAFNRSETAKKTIQGKVTEFGLVNPHGWLKLTVSDGNGKTSTWSFELSSATQLQKQGWGPQSVKVGQKVQASYYPLRFGSYGGLLYSIQLPNGQTLVGTAEPDRGYPKPAGIER